MSNTSLPLEDRLRIGVQTIHRRTEPAVGAWLPMIDEMRTLVELVECSGYDSLWVGDHKGAEAILWLSGTLTPEIAGVDGDWPEFDFDEIGITSNGEIRLAKGASIATTQPFCVSWHFARLTVTSFALQRPEGGASDELQLRLSADVELLQGIPAGASVDGLVATTHKNAPTTIRFDGIGIHFGTPGAFEAAIDIFWNSDEKRFSGNGYLEISSLDLRFDVVFAAGEEASDGGRVTTIFAAAEMALPGGIGRVLALATAYGKMYSTEELLTRHHQRERRLASLLSGLAMAVLLGTLLGIPFWLLGLFRVIRISGYWRAVDYVRRGRVLIVANHPSLIETFLIPLVFWPWAMFRLRMFPWSLPDKNLFRGFTPEHHERLRCIRVGRDDTLESRKLNWSAMKRVMEHFERQQCFVAHLEGGRTSKQAEHVSVGQNEMGKIKNAQILKAAWKKGAWIMPLHVKMTDGMRQDLPGFRESLRRLLLSPKCWPIRLEFRQPYKIVGQRFDEEAEKRRLELAILTPEMPA